MKPTLTKAAYDGMAAEILDFVKKNADKDHPYFDSYPEQLESKVSNYLNFRIFQKIQATLGDKKDLTILDLGCGVGDKAIVLKKLFPSFRVLGLETVEYDDPEHKAHLPHLFFEKIYGKINKAYGIELGLFDGLHIDVPDASLDAIVLYAVIEHVAPEHRKAFIDSATTKLKPGGTMIVTRCPRRYGLMEFISRKLKLGAHEWTLKKSDLVGLFKGGYKVETVVTMNNVPNNYRLTMKNPALWIGFDKALQSLYWPFATDYFLTARKK